MIVAWLCDDCIKVMTESGYKATSIPAPVRINGKPESAKTCASCRKGKKYTRYFRVEKEMEMN